MVPQLLVPLHSMPVNRNGKVDRAALRRQPLPASRVGELAAAGGGAARTPTEELLQGIWCQLLDVSKVAVDQPFFEIGGHSLLAIQMLSRLRAAFGVELPLREVFEAPTVRRLARRVDAARLDQRALEAPPMVPVPRDGELPISFAQKRLWILEQLDPGKPTYNIPIALRLDGELDLAAAERAMTEVVRRQEGLRACFREVDHRPVQVIREPFPFELPVVDLRSLPPPARDAESERLALREARRVFDLERGPLLRGCLLHLAGDRRVVLLTIHHVISDAWSMAVLVQEFAAIYGAFVEGRPSPLPEPPIQYVDFAEWQRRWLSGEVLERQLEFWRRQLRPPLSTLELPADRQPPAEPTARGRDHLFRLGPEIAGPLAELSQQQGTTLFMAMLAAFTTLLYRLTGETDVIVGTDVANRNWEETEGLIGFFVNLLVLRTDLSGSPTFRQLLDRVRATALESYAHQDLPFDQLVSELRLERGSGTTPLVDVLFVFQNAPVAPLELPGLRLRPLEIDYRVSRFNLGLFMDEADGELSGRFTYRTDLFSPAAIERLAGRLRALLAGLVADPDRPIDELDLRSEEERRHRTASEESRQRRTFGKFKQVKPKSIQLGEAR
jgi:acyl carrier protein